MYPWAFMKQGQEENVEGKWDDKQGCLFYGLLKRKRLPLGTGDASEWLDVKGSGRILPPSRSLV
jgi:hypothetical protein